MHETFSLGQFNFSSKVSEPVVLNIAHCLEIVLQHGFGVAYSCRSNV